MAQQTYNNANGKRLGTINDNSNGRTEGFNNNGKKVGQYDPRTNITTDATGKKVGSGNQLTRLF